MNFGSNSIQGGRNLLFKEDTSTAKCEDGARVMEMIKEAEESADRKFMYTLSSINDKQDDHVIMLASD